jgi:prefoldin subunit 5
MGFGLFCELTYDEGKNFIEKKLPYLREQQVELSNKIAHIKANIKLVLEALKEIQTIDDKKSKTTLTTF